MISPMPKLTIIALAFALVAGCSKKDDKKSTAGSGSAPTTPTGGSGSAADTTPPTGGSAAAGSDMAAGSDTAGSGSAAATGSAGSGATGGDIELLAAPPGTPKDCVDYREQLLKYKGCEGAWGKGGAMATAWNNMVKGSLGKTYETASDKNKKTIEGSCTRMMELSKMYPTLCK